MCDRTHFLLIVQSLTLPIERLVDQSSVVLGISFVLDQTVVFMIGYFLPLAFDHLNGRSNGINIIWFLKKTIINENIM